jgi:hypothetical protein
VRMTSTDTMIVATTIIAVARVWRQSMRVR